MRALLSLILSPCLMAAPACAQTLAQDFVHPPASARPMVRWWWFGNAVTESELRREVAAMKAGGFGGFEIQPVYPLVVDEKINGLRNLPYLSGEFLKMVGVANHSAMAAGLTTSITLGSGWPFGGPHIPLDLASARIDLVEIPLEPHSRRLALPSFTEGQRLVASFIGKDAATARPVDVQSGPIVPDEASRTLFLMVQSPTHQQVKRAGVDANGLVLDHMNAAAVRHHLTVVGEKLMAAFSERPPTSVFSDSLEVYGANWTPDMLEQFKKRRHYDLAPHLLDLFRDGPNSAALRHDWAQTMSELVEEAYLMPVTSWAQEHGTQFRSQTYGIPPVTLHSQSLPPLSEGEGADWRKFTSTRWASSANHLYGRAVTSAESWTWLHGAAFRATPMDIKAEADTLMLQGVNQFVAHGWPYSPPGIPEPGWAFYAAAVFNDHNPWWGVMPDVNLYLQRMSHVLRQGQSVADVAVFLSQDDALASITPSHEATVNGQMERYVTAELTSQILDAGFNFDYVDAASLDRLGATTKVLMLPHVERIAPEAYRKIAQLAQSGVKVIAVGALPDKAPGMMDAQADAARVREISTRLFPSGPIGEGHVATTLARLATPDFSDAPVGVGFVHRQMQDGDIYFVANTNNTSVNFTPRFRSESTTAQWWDARTGKTYSWLPGANLTLAPYESRLFVFGALARAPIAAPRALARRETRLTKRWTFTIAGQAAQPLREFGDWTIDPAKAEFSGIATYETKLNLTAISIMAGQTLLNLGEGVPLVADSDHPNGTMAQLAAPVREAAEVFVNGHRAGAIWTPPFTLDLAQWLKPGVNTLELRVANTAINALSVRQPPDYRALIARFGDRFQAQGMTGLKPLPSGLLNAPMLQTAP